MDEIKPHNGQWKGENYIFKLQTPVARKDHTCNCCNESILKGERYVTYTTRDIEGPEWETWKLHGECYVSDQPMFEGVRPKERYVW